MEARFSLTLGPAGVAHRAHISIVELRISAQLTKPAYPMDSYEELHDIYVFSLCEVLHNKILLFEMESIKNSWGLGIATLCLLIVSSSWQCCFALPCPYHRRP